MWRFPLHLLSSSSPYLFDCCIMRNCTGNNWKLYLEALMLLRFQWLCGAKPVLYVQWRHASDSVNRKCKWEWIRVEWSEVDAIKQSISVLNRFVMHFASLLLSEDLASWSSSFIDDDSSTDAFTWIGLFFMLIKLFSTCFRKTTWGLLN